MFFKKIKTIFDKEKLSEPFLSPPNSSISNCMKIYFQPCHFKAKTILSLYYKILILHNQSHSKNKT